VVAQAKITSVLISKEGGLVINGEALKFSAESGLYFTMALSEDSVIVSSENVKGKEGTDVQNGLQKFLDNLRADATETKEYLYDEKLDKGKGEQNEY
jgi:hypothetical protein